MDIDKAQSAIKAAMICGIISTALTLVITAIGIHQGQIELEGVRVNALMLIDVGLLAGLTIGLYFKSRVCAVMMVVYFLASKWLQWSQQASVMSVIVGIAFLFFYVQGMRGTFAYHKLRKQRVEQPPEPPVLSDSQIR